MTSTDALSPKKPLIVWDMVLTISLLVLGLGIAVALSFFSVFLVFASDGCGSGSTPCNSDAISIGVLVAAVAPLALFALAAVFAIVRIVKRRVAFWVAIVGTLLAAVGFSVGVAIVFSAVGMQFNM
jgi:uncharacterized BrkB/YihY/UPF0761 family membrane protein